MKTVSEQQLQAAILRAGYGPEVFTRLQQELAVEPATAAGFEAAHIAYYLGALLIIGAMGWFVTTAWDSLSGLTLALVAAVYAGIFGGVGYVLSQKPATKVPGGILVTVAVCMVPMLIYGVERQLGWWPAENPGGYSSFHPLIKGGWVLMEACTLLASFVAVRFVRFAFALAPGAYALWYMSMDGTALVFGRGWTFHEEAKISVGFGLVMLIVGYLLDGERDVDLAFWFYLFGLLTFTGGLSSLGGGSQVGKAVYCLLHLGLIGLSLLLQRRAFLVFGAIGVFIYLGDEAYGYFKDSISFAFGLTALGVVFIVAGLLYKRNESKMVALMAPLIPERIRHRHDVVLPAESYS